MLKEECKTVQEVGHDPVVFSDPQASDERF